MEEYKGIHTYTESSMVQSNEEHLKELMKECEMSEGIIHQLRDQIGALKFRISRLEQACHLIVGAYDSLDNTFRKAVFEYVDKILKEGK